MNCVFEEYIKYVDNFLVNYFKLLLSSRYEKRLVKPFIDKYKDVRYYNKYVVKENDFTTRLKVSDDVYEIIKNYGKTTIMVTHDIGEAISMADRIIVLSKSPAKIKRIYNIKLKDKSIPTNNRKDVMFNKYYDAIWKDLDTIVQWSKNIFKKILFKKGIYYCYTIFIISIVFNFMAIFKW